MKQKKDDWYFTLVTYRKYFTFDAVLKEKKYNTLKALIELGQIKSFEEFPEHVPYSILAKDAGINRERMKYLLTIDKADITVAEIIKIARVIDIKPTLLLDLLK